MQVKHDWLAHQNAILQTARETLEQQLQEKNQILLCAQSQLAATEKENHQLQQILKKYDENIQTLQNEKLFLTQEKATISGQFQQLQAALNKRTF